MRISELKNIETMLTACKKCNKEHCYKKCTSYIPPNEWEEIVDELLAIKLEQERKEND
jgi:uncharacterized Zn ribbon protein